MPGHSPTAEPAGDDAGTLTAPGSTDRGASPEGEVLDVVGAELVELIGAENLLGVSIGPDTAFDTDLEMDSIEFVALTERLQERYGGDLDFVAWLSGLEFDEIVGLRVGDLVAFIESSVP